MRMPEIIKAIKEENERLKKLGIHRLAINETWNDIFNEIKASNDLEEIKRTRA